jgi:hypothetical protein
LPTTGSKAGDAIQSDAEISSAPLFSWALIRPCSSGEHSLFKRAVERILRCSTLVFAVA